MRELTAEDEKFLVEYCMKSENRWLALAIGQIQPKLQKAIVSEELEASIKKELEACRLHGHWSLEENLRGREGDWIVMSMEHQEVKIHLSDEKGKLFVGTPARYTTCPSKHELEDLLEDMNLDSNDLWRWWFDPNKSHRSVEDLSNLNDDEIRREKIKYFTDILVRLAKAISKYREAEDDRRHES